MTKKDSVGLTILNHLSNIRGILNFSTYRESPHSILCYYQLQCVMHFCQILDVWAFGVTLWEIVSTKMQSVSKIYRKLRNSPHIFIQLKTSEVGKVIFSRIIYFQLLFKNMATVKISRAFYKCFIQTILVTNMIQFTNGEDPWPGCGASAVCFKMLDSLSANALRF